MATYKLNFGKHYESGLGSDFTVGDLQVKNLLGELGPLTLHFGHHKDTLEIDYSTRPFKHTWLGRPTFYGGLEGAEFTTWQEAVLVSLYDAFQVYSELKDGDLFLAEYDGEIQWFMCQVLYEVGVYRLVHNVSPLLK